MVSLLGPKLFRLWINCRYLVDPNLDQSRNDRKETFDQHNDRITRIYGKSSLTVVLHSKIEYFHESAENEATTLFFSFLELSEQCIAPDAQDPSGCAPISFTATKNMGDVVTLQLSKRLEAGSKPVLAGGG